MESEMEWESAPVTSFDDPLPKVEPDEDPLSGDVPAPDDVTVPDVPVPTTPAIQLVNLDELLKKSSETPCKATQRSSVDDKTTSKSFPSESERQTVQSVLQTAQAPAAQQSQTTNITISSTLTPIFNCAPENLLNPTIPPESTEYDSDVEIITVKQEPIDLASNEPEESSIEKELSELLKFDKPLPKKPSVPTRRAAATPKRRKCRPVIPKGTVPIPKNPKVAASKSPPPLPGNKVVLLLKPDGSLVASPVISEGQVQNPILSQSEVLQNGQIETVSSPSDSRASQIHVIRQNKVTNGANLAAQTPSTHSGLNGTNPPNNRPVSSKPSIAQPLWPPPGWYKRKIKKKLQLPLPLSGSWTNPNPPTNKPNEVADTKNNSPSTDVVENDPLEGPVQDVIPFPNQPAKKPKQDLSIGTFVKVDPFNCLQRSAATQCNLFTPPFASLAEMAVKTEPPQLMRPNLKPCSRGVGLSVQSKLILYNVMKYLELRKAYYKLRYKVAEVTENATGVSAQTCAKVMREAREVCNVNDPKSVPAFKGPKRIAFRARSIRSNLHVDTALRRYFHEHFLKKKQSPNHKAIKSRCTADGFKSGHKGQNFIRRRTRELGFEVVRTARRKIVIEGEQIRSWRYQYVTEMKTFLEEKKNVVFTFVVHLRESSVDWEVIDSFGQLNGECRLLTVCSAADKNGLIDGSFLMNDSIVDPKMFKKNKSYLEWLELQVLKKIPAGSVVVLAYEKFHVREDSDQKPNAGNSKQEIIDWLKSRVVGSIDESVPKCVLLEKASRFPVKQKYSVDSLVETYGHTAVHLPWTQKDLNTLEYVWEDIRSKYCTKGKLKFLPNALEGEFAAAESSLKKAWKQVKKCFESYRKMDPLVDDAQEAAIRKLGGIWNSPSSRPLPDETGEEVDVDLNISGSDSDDSDSSGSSSDESGSDSDSDSDSSDSEDSASSESSSSDSDSAEHVAHSASVNGNKN